MNGQKAKSITVIPQTINPLTRAAVTAVKKRRVGGYARVSTDSDEQFTSYEAQIDYYTQYIRAHDNWEFVKIYPDEGISGLNTKKRGGFNEMIADALAGKLDLIVTKSVSRFARNTVDSLTTIRMLMDHGVEVYFEKENIWTFDSKGELLLTIMSSLAQEESRSISENVTWGQRKRFADGKVSMPYKHFLGYDRGPDGTPIINPEQAELVRRIYDLFMAGKTPGGIARLLTEEGIPTPAGKAKWQDSTIKSILTNEKYKGDARLQKKFTVDYLQKKVKVNEGEVPQYYVENSHPAIIPPELFDTVQKEMARRKAIGRNYSGTSVFSCRIVCADCGSFYGSKVWNSTDRYARTVWQCNNKFRAEKKCSTPHIPEDEIKRRFLTAFNQLIPDREELIEGCRLIQSRLTDCGEIDEKLRAVYSEMEVVGEMVRQLVDENSRASQDQDDYQERYGGLNRRYSALQKKRSALETARTARVAKMEALDRYIAQLETRDGPLVHFDGRLWLESIDRATVYHDGRIVFRFIDGTEIPG